MNRRRFLRGLSAACAAGLAAPSVACSGIIPRALATDRRSTLADFPVEGRIAYVAGPNIRIWSNGSSQQITRNTRWEGPAWSPDGTLLAASLMGDNSSDIVVLDATGKTVKQLTSHWKGTRSISEQAWGRKPAWSPDGKRVAYISDDGPVADGGFKAIDMSLFVVDADGKNTKRLIVTPYFTGGVDWPTWSPDGKRIAYAQFEMSKTSQIQTYRLDTEERRPLTEYPDGAYAPAWSPDGNWIAYTLRDKTKHDIYALPVESGEAVRLTDSGTNVAPAWSPDGGHLAYISQGEDATSDIFVLKLNLLGGLVVEGSKQLTRGEQVKTTSGLSWAR